MGDFTFDNPPKRSGSYVRWRVKQAESLPVAVGEILAVPFRHDWGPDGEPVLLNSFAEFVAIYGRGETNYTEGFLAAYNGFKGEGPSIEPGAGAILGYRMCGSAGAKATRALGNVTPAATALTATARYKGTFGNGLLLSVRVNAKNPTTQKDLVISKGGFVLETWTHLNADIAGLVAAINANSGWITAVANINGVALANVTNVALTGGNDGNTLVAGDYTTAQDKLVSSRFAALSPANLTDSSIVTSLTTWAADLNARQKSKRFTVAIGGALDEDYATAEARTAGIDDENVANWGVGSYRDRALTANDPRGEVMSTAQLAPRMAGIILKRGISAAISFAQLEDIDIVHGPTDDEVIDGIENGVILVGLGNSGVRFERGVTALVSDTADKPLETWGVLKYAFTAQRLESRINDINENGNVVGKLGVNNDTREHLVREARGIVDEFIAGKGVQRLRAGEGIGIATDPPPDDDQDFVALEWVLRFSRALEQVRNTLYVS